MQENGGVYFTDQSNIYYYMDDCTVAVRIVAVCRMWYSMWVTEACAKLHTGGGVYAYGGLAAGSTESEQRDPWYCHL